LVPRSGKKVSRTLLAIIAIATAGLIIGVSTISRQTVTTESSIELPDGESVFDAERQQLPLDFLSPDPSMNLTIRDSSLYAVRIEGASPENNDSIELSRDMLLFTPRLVFAILDAEENYQDWVGKGSPMRENCDHLGIFCLESPLDLRGSLRRITLREYYGLRDLLNATQSYASTSGHRGVLCGWCFHFAYDRTVLYNDQLYWIRLHSAWEDEDELLSREVFCKGGGGCTLGNISRIIDGDTLQYGIGINGGNISLSLIFTPKEGEPGYEEAKRFTESLCPVGMMALIDRDSGFHGSENAAATIFCGDKHLSYELLNAGLAQIDLDLCSVSQAGREWWARDLCKDHLLPEP